MTFRLSKNQLLNKVLWLIILLVLTGAVFAFIKYQDSKTAPVVIVAGEQKINEETPRYKISAQYPVVVNDTEIVSFVNNSISEFKKYLPEAGIQSDRQYELDISYETDTSAKFGTTSYIMNVFSDTGGAHPSHTTVTFTFDTQGKKITNDDLFGDSYEKAITMTKNILRPKLLAELAKSNEVSQSEYETDMLDGGLGLSCLDDKNVFHGDKCGMDGFLFTSNFDNFTITDTGITFIFNEYQVAPYVNGPQVVVLSWAELKPYLNPNFSVALK